MTNQHPITPQDELVQTWMNLPLTLSEILVIAARWGANMELDACCKEILAHPGFEQPDLFVELLLDKRRPKPPSLKEQALEALGPEPLPENSPSEDAYLNRGAIERHRTIRAALEALPE